jgi:hypothetical protein
MEAHQVSSDGHTQEDLDHAHHGAFTGQGPLLRQRRQPGGRPHKHTVRLSADEQNIVAARAGQAGVSVARFLAEAGLAGDARAASARRGAAAELLAVRRLLAAIGGNINQLAETAQAAGQRPPALEATMHATARILARLDEVTAAYGHLGLPHGLRPDRARATDDPVDVDVEGTR